MRPLRELLRGLAALVHRGLPKGRYAVLWGWPDYEDSTMALEAALQEAPIRRVVLLLTDASAPPPVALGPKTRRVPKRSLRGLALFLCARYVFFTHRCFVRRFPPAVVSVNVWHGMPIKRIGLLWEHGEAIEARHVLATSALWADVMARSLVSTGPVLTTGLPRNDRLFTDRSVGWAALGLDQRDDVERLLVWLPTFRQRRDEPTTVDGRSSASPFQMDGIDHLALNELLRAHRCLAVVKPHPLAVGQRLGPLSHVQVVDDAWLRAQRLSLYQLLGTSDLLVSDVSSVTVDYLLLDRPIVHAIGDLAEYRGSRGFSIEPVEDVFMGQVATDGPELLAALEAVLTGGDPAEGRRRQVRDRFHEHLDGMATARLLAAVGLGAEP